MKTFAVGVATPNQKFRQRPRLRGPAEVSARTRANPSDRRGKHRHVRRPADPVLRAASEQMVEVNRPHGQARRLDGKSDPLDAEQIARAITLGDELVVLAERTLVNRFLGCGAPKPTS